MAIELLHLAIAYVVTIPKMFVFFLVDCLAYFEITKNIVLKKVNRHGFVIDKIRKEQKFCSVCLYDIAFVYQNVIY